MEQPLGRMPRENSTHAKFGPIDCLYWCEWAHPSAGSCLTSGATGVHFESPWKAAGWHNMGTARMGSDPATSVVDARGRAHEVRNLFVIDGSVFVTSAGVNPTSTIQALALYIADHMKKNLANLFD